MTAKPKPGKVEKHRHVYFRHVCKICGRKKRVVPKTERAELMDKLDFITREIVRWRDGWQCVERETDGCNCKGGPQWGHVLNQHGHKAIVWDLLNSHIQCAAHNHIHGPQERYEIYYGWFRGKFGQEAFDHLAEAGRGPELEVIELRELLAHHEALYERRPALHDFDELVRRGYYGEWLLQKASEA